ncbi:MAG: cation:proton antiporter, partial [Chloroflexi bacterium]|nr:cation:proton antiporter [Chloroflexota bacterium]
GLETDLRQLLRYKVSATLVAVGGVFLPFVLGAAATVALGFAASFTDPVALFMGAIMTATSVGITARVLSDQGKLNSPEGVTVMGAAVVDDVLGIMVLTVAVGIGATGHVSLGNVGWVSLKAVLFWLGLTGLGILLASRISRFFSAFKVSGAALALALALAFLSSALAESFGLAMIIGAYSIGLAISQTPLARNLEEGVNSVYYALVPIFFVVMGMLVNVSAMREAVLFGVVITLLAILGKVAGCGVAAIGTGFNLRGAWRIGIGMLPRGEVALIIAGVGLSRGVIQEDLFGVSIMMTVVTTLMAPIIMVSAFGKGGSGRRAVKASGVPGS